MTTLPSPSSARCHRARRSQSRPQLEELEARDLPAITFGSGSSFLPAESPVNDTLDQSVPLTLGADGTTEVSAVVGDSPAGAADVDFYSFTLSEPSHVILNVRGDGSDSSLSGALSLYGPDSTTTTQFRVVAQDDGATHGGDAGLETDLGAGTWYAAISGTGNRYFHPFLADSGYDGDTGTYTLTVGATGLGLTTADGPVLLSSTPAPESVLSRSPSVLRLAFSGALDKGTFTSSTVQLIYNAGGTFGGPGDQTVSIASLKFVSSSNKLLLTPATPLQEGFYQVFLAGDQLAHTSVITGGSKPLGKDATHATGQDFAFTFQVDGVEGNTADGAGADDTLDTAHSLGDVTSAGLVQVDGAIGDDPTDPIPFNPSDVDVYRFEVSGPGLYALSAEVFAGRIGSSLGPALTLFQLGPNPTDPPTYLASNDSTLNDTQATDGSVPLLSDPALFTGLTAGEYLLAVSSAFNYPDAFTPPGTSGVFDPLTTHSGSAGGSTGEYVLNLLVQPAPEPPRVVSVSLAEGSTLDGPPTTITVQFDHAVNLRPLSFEAYRLTGEELLPAVFVSSDGQSYFPRLQSYDPETNQATFVFFEAVPAGPAEFHLSGHPASGDLGVTGLGGAPLAGNEPGNPDSDYVVHFNIADTPRGSAGSSTYWMAQEPNDTFDAPQVLGPLFPLELASGVSIERSLGTASADSADYFQFEVLQTQDYLVALTNVSGLPSGVLPEVLDGPDHPVDSVLQGDGSILVTLTPGTYVLRVQGWAGTDAASVAYTATITLQGAPELPTPLTTGPAPALRIRLNDTAPPPPPPAIVPPPVPQVVLGNATGTPAPSVASGEASMVIAVSSSQTGAVEQSRVASSSLFDSLPSRILLSLAASPLGGTSGPTQGETERPELVTLPSSTPALPESLARLVLFVGLLTAPGEITNGADPAQPLPPGPDPGLEGVTRCLLVVSRQGQGVAFTAGDTLRHLTTEAVRLFDSSVSVLDHLFTRWTPSNLVTLPSPNQEPRIVAVAAPDTPAPAEAGEAKPEEEPRSWWPPAAGIAWGGALALALFTTQRISRRRKTVRSSGRSL